MKEDVFLIYLHFIIFLISDCSGSYVDSTVNSMIQLIQFSFAMEFAIIDCLSWN